MKHQHVRRSVILAGALILALGARARGAEVWPTPSHAASLSIARYYSGSLGNVGEFPGKLVRLLCDPNRSRDAARQCDTHPYDYALVIEGNDTIHPLLPGTEEIRRELDRLRLDESVLVHGKYYPSTGTILVGRIATAQ